MTEKRLKDNKKCSFFNDSKYLFNFDLQKWYYTHIHQTPDDLRKDIEHWRNKKLQRKQRAKEKERRQELESQLNEDMRQRLALQKEVGNVEIMMDIQCFHLLSY